MVVVCYISYAHFGYIASHQVGLEAKIGPREEFRAFDIWHGLERAGVQLLIGLGIFSANHCSSMFSFLYLSGYNICVIREIDNKDLIHLKSL